MENISLTTVFTGEEDDLNKNEKQLLKDVHTMNKENTRMTII